MMIRIVCVLVLFFHNPSLYAQNKASEALIPYPTEISWNTGQLDVADGIRFEGSKKGIEQELALAKTIFTKNGVSFHSHGKKHKLHAISLKIDRKLKEDLGEEGYFLEINSKGIAIRAFSNKGLFYALQTLRQFKFENKTLPFVSIKDVPQFSLRGFLVDVGRNYQPMDMLKEQIDIMARYKLNLLHFHFTEDIAWRLESKKFPGLTDASNMTRWPGKYYSIAEFKELIRYCQERHIQFLPEIDMPGHSAAFERYFGYSMQTEQGIARVKELLVEFADHFPEIAELHIGGDEVKITNKQFMPEITKFVEQMGFRTYGWEPGSNLEEQTIRQLWMGGAQKIDPKSNRQYVDSKHLYINHMDPLETVSTLFFRRFAEEAKETDQLRGAILCSWPDRAVTKPEDMFLQSAIYPSILTFGDRAWQGNGELGWKANLPDENSPAFRQFQDFEQRLLTHKALYFKDKHFPFVANSQMRWELIGPFDNAGETTRKFPIEENPFGSDFSVTKIARGGTIILRHWWADVLQGAIEKPTQNSTWYARTKIWSDEEGIKNFWIGFNNFSRSYASDSPSLGKWDDLGSQVWVNKQIISPPHWKQAGKKGAMEIPLIDEGYSFRKPSTISLKKGWNEVLIKLPVSKLSGKDWQNPLKWMFTFVPYQ